MKGKPTRRTFFVQAGAALAAPLAAGTAAAADGGHDDLGARLGALEDANAIRALEESCVRLLCAARHAELAALFVAPAEFPCDATIRSVTLAGERRIVVAGATATARSSCIVETATPIEDSGTLVAMARLQGDGVVRRSARRVLASSFIKAGGVWRIKSAELLT
jgi:hypothetical protein